MSTKQLAPILRAAAKQRRYMIPRHRDIQRAEDGRGQTLHAVDTNVIMLYSRPWKMSIHSENRRQGYAEIFPGDDPEISIALGQSLAEYIAHRLSGRLPLVVLPPHEEEVQRRFRDINIEAGEEGETAELKLNAMKQLIKQVEEADNTTDAVRHLTEHATQIARFLGGERSAKAEARRFRKILQEQRVASLDFVIDNGFIHNQNICQLLEAPVSLKKRFEILWLRDKWLAMLHGTKSSQVTNITIENDAHVLARLEWINKQLHELSDVRPNDYTNLVLITADEAMHRAAINDYSFGTGDDSFADLFLRHPRAYLDAPGVLSPPENSAQHKESDSTFGDWLDTLLTGAGLIPGTPDYATQLDELITKDERELVMELQGITSQNQDILKKFMSGWGSYTSSLAIDQQPSSIDIPDEHSDAGIILTEYKNLVARLENELDEHIRKNWEECFGAVAEGGYRLRRSRNSTVNEIPPRNIPILYFDRFSKTREFVQTVLRSYEFGGLDGEKWDQALNELEEDDNSGYTFYVALGLLFAAENVWRVAAILAQRALAIAEREKIPKISGREAAFLRAVALRHSARNMAELRSVGDLLDRTEHLYEQDRREFHKEKNRDLQVGPCRFQSERLALYLTYHLYGLLLGQKIPERVPSLESIAQQIDAALMEIDLNFEPREVPAYVQRNLAVNAMMTAIMRARFTSQTPDLKDIRRYWQILKDNVRRGEDEFPPSYYVRAILLVGNCLFAEGRDKKNAAAEASKHLAEDIATKKSIMTYDRKRFELLRDVVLHGLRGSTPI